MCKTVGRESATNFEIIMKLKINQIKNFLLLALLFFLPWQTRLIYQTAFIGKSFWEYGSLSLYGTEILLGVIILLFLIETIRGNFNNFFVRHFNTKRLAVILIGLVSFFSLYLLTSVNRSISWQYLNWLIYGICLSFIILMSEIDLKKLTLVVWGGGLGQGIIAIWQFFNQYIPANKWLGMSVQNPQQLGVAVVEFGDERWLRAYGAFGWPNSLGIYLATIFVLGIILLNLEKNNKLKVFLFIGQILVLSGLFFSFARGAWLAAAVGVFVTSLKNYKNRFFWQQIALYTIVFSILIIIFKPLVFSRLDFQNRLEKTSLSQRVSQLTEFKQVFSKNNFVGSGPGSYTMVLHNLYPKYFVDDLKPVHNIYLLFIAEWGAVGLFLLSWFLIYTKKILNWSFPPLIVLLIAGFFDHWSISTFIGLIFLCLMVGLSVKYVGIDTKVSQE